MIVIMFDCLPADMICTIVTFLNVRDFISYLEVYPTFLNIESVKKRYDYIHDRKLQIQQQFSAKYLRYLGNFKKYRRTHYLRLLKDELKYTDAIQSFVIYY